MIIYTEQHSKKHTISAYGLISLTDYVITATKQRYVYMGDGNAFLNGEFVITEFNL